MKFLINFTAFLLISLAFSACTGTFYVVRHGDRLNNTDTTSLSNDGFARANTLRDTLLNKGIDSIFVSTKKRTQQTAQPLAIALKKQMRIYNRDTLESFVRTISKIKREVLVVSHSEQIQTVVNILSGQTVPEVNGTDFDNMYIIKIKINWLGQVSKSLVVTRYGVVTN
jgi:broad specificity phosphatase PhoE